MAIIKFHHGIISILIILLSTSWAAAQSGPTSGSSSDELYNYNPKFSPSIGIIVIILIVALFFMGFFSIYLRHCTDSSSGTYLAPSGTNTARVSRRTTAKGLDAAVVATFPTFVYEDVKTLKIGKGALECAVCLNEFEDDETLRLIPKCDHVFHPDCIDAWLGAHTTCPVCRANLVPQPGESTHLAHLNHNNNNNIDGESVDSVVVDVGFVTQEEEVDEENEENREVNESMSRPLRGGGAGGPEVVDLSGRLNRNRTRRMMMASGRPRWLGKYYSRSNSTGHVAVKQWESMDRFTLRLPEDVRKQVMSGKLTRSTSMLVLPRDGSTRRGNRFGGLTSQTGEGSSRGGKGATGRFDRSAMSDRWGNLLGAGFFSRWPSLRLPKVAVSGGGSMRSGGGSLRSANNSVPESKGDVALSSTVELVRPPV